MKEARLSSISPARTLSVSRSARVDRRAATQGSETQAFWKQPIPQVVISIGGGWLRAWEQTHGLLTEIPMVVLWDDLAGEVRAWGSEAQQMEGKTSMDQRVLRPWWNGELIDRTVLRGLLEQFWLQVCDHFPWWQRPLVALRVRVVVDPTLSTLHRRWLLATLREAGLWGVRSVDGLQAVARRAAAGRLIGVVDVGFSGVRAAVYGPTGHLLAAARTTRGSLFWTAQQMVDTMREQQNIDIPATRFYDQQWWVQHAGFDRTRQRAVVQPIPKTAVKQSHQAAAHAVVEHLNKVLQPLSVEQRTHLAENGWVMFGGGVFPELLTQVQTELEMPLRAEGQSRYAELVAVA